MRILVRATRWRYDLILHLAIVLIFMSEIDRRVCIVAHHLRLLLKLGRKVLGPLQRPNLVLGETFILKLVVNQLLN